MAANAMQYRWMTWHKPAALLLLLSCYWLSSLSSPGLAQTARMVEDGNQQNEVWDLIQNRQLLLRAVFDKFPTSPRSFATAVDKRRKEIQQSEGLTKPKAGEKSFARDEEWSRELVNLEQPQLRYDAKVPRPFTALESTTLLLNNGRTFTYLEESKELLANYSIGLLYDAELIDSKNWNYVYKADAHSSNFVNSDGKPPQDDPNPDGKPSKDTAAKNNRIKGFYDRTRMAAELERISVKSAEQFAPMNEILVGLSKDALKGVYFSVTPQGAQEDGVDYITLQAISRRQLVRTYLKKNLPLLQIPYGMKDNNGQIFWWTLDQQRLFLEYLSKREDLTDVQLAKVADLSAKLLAEINGN
jgi:hypothetical protein